MGIKETLELASKTLTNAQIDHALIGGIALALWGVHRATADVDLLVDGDKKTLAKNILTKAGFQITHESEEVIQFSGAGYLDLLFANRALSKKMIAQAIFNNKLSIKCVKPEDIIGLKIQAYTNDPKRFFQDIADIKNLIDANNGIDWNQIKMYADLFNKWSDIEKLKS